MAAAAAPRLSSRAAATETRVRALFDPTINMDKIDDKCSPCSVRVHGPVVVFCETRKIGDTRSRSEPDDDEPYFWYFDHRIKVADPSLFRNQMSCSDLIYRMLADAPCTGKYDLAAENWEHFEPDHIATTIVAGVRRDTKDTCGVFHAYAVDIEMPLHLRLIYSEPKALLLACKEAAETVAGVSAMKRKRRREPAGELCAICLLDFLETKEDATTRLPCAHAFHSWCIGPWFDRVSTCPICRRDSVKCIRHDADDAVVDEVGLETGDGEGNDDGHPIQVDMPVRARRQPARLADYSLA